MQIIRFVDDPHTTVRLDLNDGVIWTLARGFDLGITPARRLYLSQDGVDGAVLADSDRPITQMTLPLLLYHSPDTQPTPAQIRAGYNNLVTELDRHHNNIEFRENGDVASFFVRTYRADIPSLRRGFGTPSAFGMRTGGPALFITLDRDPEFTGAGAHI